MVSLVLTVSPGYNEINAKIKNENYYEVFDSLYERDYLESQGELVVDTINDGNKVVEINNITYDKKVFYSTLYKESKQGKIKDKISKIKEKDKSKKHDKLTNLDQMLMDFNNGEVDYIDIVIFLEQYDIILDYSDLFTELIPTDGVVDDRAFTTLTSYLYETVSTSYYEDYDANYTTYAIYHKQVEYYLDSNDNIIYTGNHRYVIATDPSQISYYSHQSTESFTYNPDGSSPVRPEVEYTLIVDYLGYQKMILTDTDGDESPYKMTQEMHYNRNMYNCVNYEDSISCHSIASTWYCMSAYGGLNYGACEPVTNLSQNEILNLNFSGNHSNYFHELLVTDGFSREKFKKPVYYYDLRLGKYTYGSLEAIIIDHGNNVYTHDTNPLRMATFNFGVPESEQYGSEAHRFRDVYPYLVWGNSLEDYLNHSPYERFIWDKCSIYNFCSLDSLEGASLISKYESFWCPVKGLGGDIPQEIIDADMYLDFNAPTISQTYYSFTIGTVSNINWETFINPTDNFTVQNEIVIEEIYDHINYYVAGTYYVKIELTDLVGNSATKYITVRMISPSGGGGMME